MAPLHFLGQDGQNEVQPDISGHVTPFTLALVSQDVDGIINGTTSFLSSGLSKWKVT